MFSNPDSVLPQSALDRLFRQRDEQARGEGLFSSTLGSNEFLLMARDGFEPLGQVLGACAFQIGGQWAPSIWWNSDRQRMMQQGLGYELTVATAAWHGARQTAVDRLLEEAAILGATMVAGVTLDYQPIELSGGGFFNGGGWNFLARGTALRHRGTGTPGRPYASNLSGSELWKLHQAGYTPAGLVWGTCYYLHMSSLNTSQMINPGLELGPALQYSYANSPYSSRLWYNQELADLSGSVYAARELAMERLESNARHQGADGVVGMEQATFLHEVIANVQAGVPDSQKLYEPFIVEVDFFALGTAVRYTHPDTDPPIQPTLALD